MAKPETLKRVLRESDISAEIVGEINKGFESVTDKSSRKKKAEFLFHAISVMEAGLDDDKLQEVMNSCACTIGSSLDRKTEQFAKRTHGLSLADKLKQLCEIKHLGTPVLQADGTIVINQTAVTDKGLYYCPCPQINGTDIADIRSGTYCLCCAGHFKYQYEKALSVKLDIAKISSPLESNGTNPCSFVMSIIQSRSANEKAADMIEFDRKESKRA